MYLHTSNIKKILTIPSYILDDNSISLAAKGLYVQLYYSNSSINSLKELTNYTNNSEEELKSYFEELTKAGYITIKDNRCDLLQKAVSDRSSKKTDVETASNYTEVVQEKPKSAYEKMILLIQSYKFNEKIENLLITYFEKWLNGRGRFAQADKLHGYVVRAKINDLVSFKLSDDDMITVIQESIDNEWFKFVNPANKVKNNTSNSSSNFDKTKLKSGTYTQEEIDRILKKKAELESEDVDSDDEDNDEEE
jgi:hypothetical protein